MFVSHIFPRERSFPDVYHWNNTYVKMSGSPETIVDIEEVKEKTRGTRAIDILSHLNTVVKQIHENHFNNCNLKVKCLNSENYEEGRTFNSLDEASLVINHIVLRVVLGYENAYQNLSLIKRVGILKRIQIAIYLLFGWETERDKIHKLALNIHKILYNAEEGLLPNSLSTIAYNRTTLVNFLVHADQRKIIFYFNAIFHGKRVPPDNEIENLKKYLVNDDLEILTEDGQNYLKINSMKPIIEYLKENPDTKNCDFRACKTFIEDIRPLAQYLADSACQVEAIAINRNISQNAKEELAKAANARKTLVVQYFD